MTQTGRAPATILALGIIVAALIGAYAFISVRSADNTIQVTGSAIQDATADTAKWTVSVSRIATQEEIGSATSRVADDAQQVINFFNTAGITPENISTTPVFADQVYSSDPNAPTRYNVREDISIQSNDPALVEKLSKQISSLARKGILVSPQQPEYYVTTLPKLRVALIGRAVQDAKARAMEIASSTGQHVGALKAASSGVVQVMEPNSVDVSDYGSYDTRTIDKQVMVTARATFFLK